MPVDAAIPAAIADYRILGLLGEGNHGRFYLAEAPERLGLSDGRVALKVFAGQVSEDAYRRGVRELRAFAAVRSPYLVRIYDAVLEDNFLYAMEYFPLGSLAAPTHQLTRDQILRALVDASRAVHELHEAGMVHGDIKPGNVMVDENGGKLSDLGLVRVLNSSNTVTSMAPATSVEYLDPGLLYGDTPSRASDIWAIGATLNRALSGEGLYGELPVGQPMLAIRAVHSGKSRISAKLRPEEAEFVASCLAKPGMRPRTAAEVADRIAALIR
ncbi:MULTISPECIES: serine/threonine-protein kinase [Antrihabitans]|jgi:eukaryotic-like serine/threonine-protein kinase|uniref:Serine/threonine protein kinase n=2 Tax=Antrihabitans TaxID=2799491 RepID=A0A934NNR6_9NOCA|nr:serine/threonine-protein kinase [Antrihabitans stalagmiti]MBJ8338569.1 serine/threonine protein kinase [Antrihabitans stalagmiti]